MTLKETCFKPLDLSQFSAITQWAAVFLFLPYFVLDPEFSLPGDKVDKSLFLEALEWCPLVFFSFF